MPRIVLSSSMLRDYARLPHDVAGKVSNLITNFAQQAFAGAHIEAPKAARDPQARTVRIDNFWRIFRSIFRITGGLNDFGCLQV